MKKIVTDERMITHVCDMYYNQDMTQTEIAKEMEISRPTVASMLKLGKQYGIVKISISSPEGRGHFELERKLQKKYGLKEVIIADKKDDDAAQKDALGLVTAIYLQQILKEGNIVGVSMGTTLSHVAKFVNQTPLFENLTFIPVVGGMGQIETELHANHIAQSLAKCFGGNCLHFHVPAVVSRYRTKEELMKETFFKQVFQKYDNVDVALMGVGNLEDNSTMVQAGYYTEEQMEDFRNMGAVGDICLKVFDENGNPDVFESNQLVLAADVKEIGNKPYAIAVLSGAEKARAVRAAILGGLVNVLIVDYSCGKALYDYEG